MPAGGPRWGFGLFVVGGGVTGLRMSVAVDMPGGMGERRQRGVSVEEFLRIVLALPEVTEGQPAKWIGLKVRNKGFAYLLEGEGIVMLKATREEQAAWVAQDPEVYQPTHTSGRFGWVQVRLALVSRDELDELITEAWCLSAPKRLVAAYEAEVTASG